MTDVQFDIAVIGGGPGGYVAAIRAAQLGLKPVQQGRGRNFEASNYLFSGGASDRKMSLNSMSMCG